MLVKASFDATLKKYGHNILLQRLLNPLGDNDDDAGTEAKYSMTLEVWTVRHTNPASITLGNVQKEVTEGIIHEADMSYYFQSEANPREGDRIYENLERFPNDIVTWIIDAAIPMRGSSGIIEFWHCGTSRETP